MGKVRRLIALVKESEIVFGVAATFAAILGVTSAILSITGMQFHIGIALLLIAVALAATILFHFRGLVSPQVAVDDVLSSDNLDTLLTHLHCPCDLGLSTEAKNLARDCYATKSTIGPDLYEQLRVKSPFILACLTDRRGKFLGYFDAIPIRESFAGTFLGGRVTETQITHEDVLPPEEMHKCKYLFISGLAVHNPNTHAGRRNANILVWALLKYLAHFVWIGKTFGLCGGGHERRRSPPAPFQNKLTGRSDEQGYGYRLYSLVMTREEIAKRLAYLPDWQLLCLLDWVKAPKSGKQHSAQRRPSLPTKTWPSEDSLSGRRSFMENGR